jgi:hypothetical protein
VTAIRDKSIKRTVFSLGQGGHLILNILDYKEDCLLFGSWKNLEDILQGSLIIFKVRQ